MLLMNVEQYRKNNWKILCDFDGTISLQDTTDELLEHFADDGWQDIEELWEQGQIGSKECMQRQIALLNVSKQDLEAFVQNIKIDESFIEFVKLTKYYGIPLTIVSDGLDQVIRCVLAKYNLMHVPVIANQLQQVSDTRWQLAFPNASKTCNSQSGTCKCKVSKQHQQYKTILIGDGRSDFCLSERADYVYAKTSLLKHCQKNKISHVAFHRFDEISASLEQFVQSQKMTKVISL
ncbi:MtnX-like HAD-IB family phosphatase [Acinetobacter sp. B10A]|uniref:MtnX-like HAD-IB family phosphatase n=1 Tax=Acinetobacter baretiae TaxID=2605383 RepID=UPI001B3C78AF|nr:MtnX-like HAD-IB family phosphatase [Acinetobacter baretiae]MBF7685093.1 MtnX-like HAD-IB family phosphatase [Acinetobacter baretiae]